jgi:2-oxoglutarate ferredoxin oxidoreductase subunit delta
LKGAERIEIDPRYCKGCMLCQYVCKFEVFEAGQERSALDYRMPRVAKMENCRVCGLCEINCPDLALTVVAKKKGKGKES